MKLTTLFEGSNALNKETVKTIIDDCRPYFNAINNDIDGSILYRGLVLDSFRRRAKEVAENVYLATVRKDRVSLNTPNASHAFIDAWMEKNLGAKFRSAAIFCVANYRTALSFGKPHVVLPIGEFKYAWSPFVEDLYSDFDNIGLGATPTSDEREDFFKKLEQTLEGSKYRTTELTRAIKEYPKHEIMVECDSYYAIGLDTYNSYFFPLFNMVSK